MAIPANSWGSLDFLFDSGHAVSVISESEYFTINIWRFLIG